MTLRRLGLRLGGSDRNLVDEIFSRLDTVSMNGARNVLDVLRTEIVENDRELVGNLFVYRAGNAYPTGTGQSLQARGDIHTVAERSPSVRSHPQSSRRCDERPC